MTVVHKMRLVDEVLAEITLTTAQVHAPRLALRASTGLSSAFPVLRSGDFRNLDAQKKIVI